MISWVGHGAPRRQPASPHLSVSGVMTSRGVLPRYSYEYWIWASQMLAKQCFFSSSQRCRSWDCQVKAWELSTCRATAGPAGHQARPGAPGTLPPSVPLPGWGRISVRDKGRALPGTESPPREEEAAGAEVPSASPKPSSPALPRRSRLGRDHLGHHVSRVHVDGADGHDLHPVASVEVPNEQGDERVQLTDLQEQRPLDGTPGGARPHQVVPGLQGCLGGHGRPVGKTTELLFTIMTLRKQFSIAPNCGWGSYGAAPHGYHGATKNGTVEGNLVPWKVEDIK